MDELTRVQIMVRDIRDARKLNADHPSGTFTDDGAAHIYACGCAMGKWPDIDNEYCEEQRQIHERLRMADRALFEDYARSLS